MRDRRTATGAYGGSSTGGTPTWQSRSRSSLLPGTPDSSASSLASPSPTARRSRPGLNPLSPLSRDSLPSSSSRSVAGAAPSVVSGRRSFLSSGASNAGSTYTSATALTQMTRATHKRGHTRKKAALPTVRTDNPDDFDLSSLEDADEVFRLYHVKDVQSLERRARSAADAKVAELRSMVGERYRDLLSAADSIVRMRDAADKLVDRLEAVQASVSSVGAPGTSTPTRLDSRDGAATPAPVKSLLSTPALSLSIQLLLTIPSAVHHLVDSADYLAAARLDSIGRLLYDKLHDLRNRDDDEQFDAAILDMFPIIDTQHDTIHGLRSLIKRRTVQDLRRADLSSESIAKALAALMLLDESDSSSALEAFLHLRSDTLAGLLDVDFGNRQHDEGQVVALLSQTVSLAISTATSVHQVFGTADASGLLPDLLANFSKSEAATEGAVSHPLANLPNFALLKRHLPDEILANKAEFPTDSLHTNPIEANDRLNKWAAQETAALVKTATAWLQEMRGGATALGHVRQAIRALSANAPKETDELLAGLFRAIDSRLEQVYQQHLQKLVSRLRPTVDHVIKSAPSSRADTDPSVFLFETALPFPPPSHYANASRKAKEHHDPYELFASRLLQRVEDRSPLFEQAMKEIEAHARDLRQDLLIWLQDNENSAEQLHAMFIASSEAALEQMYAQMAAIVADHGKNPDVSLLLAKLVMALSHSKTFTSDLLLADDMPPNPKVSALRQRWIDRLEKLQKECLPSWIEAAVATAATALAADTPSGRSSLRPEQPSRPLLASLRSLLSSAWRASSLRSVDGVSVGTALLEEYEDTAFEILSRRIKQGDDDDAFFAQSLFDIKLLRKLRGDKQGPLQSLEQQVASRLHLSDPKMVDQVEKAAVDYLRRTQTIFAPIVEPLTANGDEQGKAHTNMAGALPGAGLVKLLPLGPAAAQQDVRPIISIVKPGARLGLLPVRS